MPMDRHWNHLKSWKNPFSFHFIPFISIALIIWSISSNRSIQFFPNHLIIFFFQPELLGIRLIPLPDQSYGRVAFFISSSIFPVFSPVCVVLFIFFATGFWPIVFCFSKAFFFQHLRVSMFSPFFSCKRCSSRWYWMISCVTLLPEMM